MLNILYLSTYLVHIGGSPGGISFGLKQIMVTMFIVSLLNPNHMLSMLLGLATKEFDGVTVDAFGIESGTIMDGLAVPRTSGLIFTHHAILLRCWLHP